jgi:4-hydroxybenzoate polyprenyltransferase
VALIPIARFIRADTLGASITMVLLGAATADAPLPAGAVLPLVATALSFHLFAYLLNDVVDLPIDRTDPRRAASPLVLGLVSPGLTLAIALIQLPVLVALVFRQEGTLADYLTLAVLVGAVAIYDLWGKRCPLPPVTDLVQGVAWAALGWLAAGLVGEPTGWTLILAAYFLVFIMLANGVHGSIRDLATDRGRGARTTATFFKAEVGDDGAVHLSRSYLGYALVLQAITVLLPFLPAALGGRGLWERGLWEWGGGFWGRGWWGPGWWGPAAMAVLGLLSTLYLLRAAAAGDRHRQLVLGARHLILVLVPLFILIGPLLPGWGLALAAGCYLVPFAFYRWLFGPRPQPGAHWTVRTPAS